MIDENQAITCDSEICKVLTCLPEKFIVDFANGIDVTQDHLRVQRARSSFFNRCYDGFTGSSHRRQAEINANLAQGLEASLQWLTDLTESLAESNLAIARVNERVTTLNQHLARVVQHAASTRHQLENLTEQLHLRCTKIENELGRIDFEQRVSKQLDSVFYRWEAGRFDTFSPAGRCFAALEELRWGVLGDYSRAHPKNHRQRQLFIEEAIDRATAMLQRDLGNQRLETKYWLASPARQLADAQPALVYLAEDYSVEQHPFVHTSCGQLQALPMQVPHIMRANRLAEALGEEVLAR